MRTMGSVSTITYTTTATATVSLVSLARGVKWVSHMTHDTHMHDTHRYMHKYQIPTHMQRVHLHSAIGAKYSMLPWACNINNTLYTCPKREVE